MPQNQLYEESKDRFAVFLYLMRIKLIPNETHRRVKDIKLTKIDLRDK